MTKRSPSLWIGLAALGVVVWTVGCDPRPDTPRRAWNEPLKVLEVDSSDPAEGELVADALAAESQYRKDLEHLFTYYSRIGDIQKTQWARTELANLNKAREFEFGGVAPSSEATPPPAGAGERTLVESVLDARQRYLEAMDDLAQHYEKKPEEFKAYVIHTVQSRFRSDETFTYMLAVELSPGDARALRIIPEADELFGQAEALHLGRDKGVGSVYDRQRDALRKFYTVIRTWPDSSKIGLSAFYIGQIYADYFKEPYLAVRWYQRALQWDPTIAKPVRYEMATEYDFRLGDKRKALALYREALAKESFYKTLMRQAAERVESLEKYVQPEPTGASQ